MNMLNTQAIVKREPWPVEQVNGLKPEDRRKYYLQILKDILRDNEGISLSQLTKALPYDARTLAKYLECLVAIGEAYKDRLGSFVFYYSNGKILHDKGAKDIQIGNKLYSFYLLKNSFGTHIYIQEKRKDELNRVSVSGGVIIPLNEGKKFIDNLKEFMERVKNAR